MRWAVSIGIKSGETISAEKGGAVQAKGPPPPPPVFATGLGLKDRKDEVKLTSALAKLIEEDPSLRVEMNADTHQMLLLGQGEMHLRVSTERLQRKYGVAVERQARLVPYKETIRAGTQVRGRHKKQSGGHGQFGDVVLDIQPRARGEGFEFAEKITGGVVPRQYIPSVEIGVKDYLQHGPLGFPVVDVSVTLLDGSYHTVDSSDMAFRQAARLGMSDGLPKCGPVLLEPVMAVEIAVPSEATARINAIIAQRRGQILGFDAREGWNGWDRGAGADAGVGDGEPDRRPAIGNVGRRDVHLALRPSGGAHRAPRRSGAGGAPAGGGIGAVEALVRAGGGIRRRRWRARLRVANQRNGGQRAGLFVDRRSAARWAAWRASGFPA